MARNSKREESRTFLISVAAELAGMHAQTLRTYDRLGLVTPRRTSGGGRRYSQHDVDLLREVQRLSQDEGVNLAGIKRVIELTNQVEALQSRLKEMAEEIAVLRGNQRRDLAAQVGCMVQPRQLVTLKRGRRCRVQIVHRRFRAPCGHGQGLQALVINNKNDTTCPCILRY